MPAVTVTVPTSFPRWPRKCACCLRDPSRVEVIDVGGREAGVPYCGGCANHVRKSRESAPARATAGVLALLPAAGVLALAAISLFMAFEFRDTGGKVMFRDGSESLAPMTLFSLALAALFATLAGVMAFRIAARGKPAPPDGPPVSDQCAAEGESVTYRGRKGAGHVFGFANEKYARLFHAANRA